MRLPDKTPELPLLALVGATAEWHAGAPPSCMASARLLDRVHFSVHRGDCVVVHHADPAGARVFLAALAGHPAVMAATGFTGRRDCARQVQVRRCAIRAEVITWLLEGWQTLTYAPENRGPPTSAPPTRATTTRGVSVVHLLRASRSGYVTRDDGAQWRRWAQRERARGGAMVVVARDNEVGAESHVPPHRTAQVHEPLVIDGSAPSLTGRVRLTLLRHGQLVPQSPSV